MSNPMNGLVSNKTLLEAKDLVDQYRDGKEPPGTTESEVCIIYLVLFIVILKFSNFAK